MVLCAYLAWYFHSCMNTKHAQRRNQLRRKLKRMRWRGFYGYKCVWVCGCCCCCWYLFYLNVCLMYAHRIGREIAHAYFHTFHRAANEALQCAFESVLNNTSTECVHWNGAHFNAQSIITYGSAFWDMCVSVCSALCRMCISHSLYGWCCHAVAVSPLKSYAEIYLPCLRK